MAYIKYKELTRYFNFNKKIPLDSVPEHIYQYLEKNEKILIAYKVSKDQIVITNKKFLIFDVRGSMTKRKIHYLPFNGISSSAIEYGSSSVSIYLTMDSGYQMKINFVGLDASAKTEMRIAYTEVMSYIVNR